MILDRNMRVSSAQDISQVVGNYVSTDSIDLGIAGIDIGAGMKIKAVFNLDTAVVGTVSTVQFQIIASAAAALTSPVVLGTTVAIAEANLLINARIFVEMNVDVDALQGLALRFFGAQYVVAVATTTAGTVTANFTLDVSDGKRFYASGFTV